MIVEIFNVTPGFFHLWRGPSELEASRARGQRDRREADFWWVSFLKGHSDIC